MVALPRTLAFGFYSESDPKQKLVPDIVKMGNQIVQSGDSIKPGEYELIARKKGYKDINEKIQIRGDSKPYIIQLPFLGTKRPVKLVFQDKEQKQPIVPERVMINKVLLQNLSLELTPGAYMLHAQLKGYLQLDEKIEIPQGTDLYTITLGMTILQERAVLLGISYHVMPESLMDTPKVTLTEATTGKVINIQEKTKIFPGKYKLEITKSGYESYKEDIDILPSQTPYYIYHTLQPAVRAVVFALSADYPAGQNIVPDKVLFNEKGIVSGNPIKPGEYTIVICKDGYQSIQEKVYIPASDQPYTVVKTLHVLERLVQIEIFDKKTKKKLTPDKVTVADNVLAIGKPFKLVPQEYEFGVFLKGYRDLKEKVLIPVGSGVYGISFYLEEP
jgi:hypothetical protein